MEQNNKPALSMFATVQEYKDAVKAFDANLKRRAEDAGRPAAEQLQWSGFDEHIAAKGKPVSVIEAFEDTFHSVFAAPAVDAAKLPPLPEPWITDGTAKAPAARHHYAEDQMVDYANEAAADLRALVAQQAARIAQLEQAAQLFSEAYAGAHAERMELRAKSEGK